MNSHDTIELINIKKILFIAFAADNLIEITKVSLIALIYAEKLRVMFKLPSLRFFFVYYLTITLTQQRSSMLPKIDQIML